MSFRRVVEAGVEVELSAAAEKPVEKIESRSKIFIVSLSKDLDWSERPYDKLGRLMRGGDKNLILST